jgi:hypothetical protein
MKSNLKIVFPILLIVASFFLAAFDTPPIDFGKPTVWPKSLDEVYRLIENGEGNWVFTSPCPANPGPSVAWAQVKQIKDAALDDHGTAQLMIDAKKLAEIVPGVKFEKTGTLVVTEKDLFNLAVYEFFTNEINTCKPANDKVMVYGSGVQDSFDKLVKYVVK